MQKEIIKALIFLVIGAGLMYKFKPNQEPAQTVVESKNKCEIVTVKEIKKDGSIVETSRIVAEQSEKIEIKKDAKKSHYLAVLKRNYDFKNSAESYEIGLGRKINENIGFLFTYDTKNVAGLGLVLEF